MHWCQSRILRAQRSSRICPTVSRCTILLQCLFQRKAAVRCQIGLPSDLPPLPAGVHSFGSDDGTVLWELLCRGPGAPVVLHYANCGYKAWCKKYRILCKGHGTPDGAFSETRPGISNIRPHLIARQLMLRGNVCDFENFYRTWIMSNEFDELPFLAQIGCVLRLEAPRCLLE